MDEDVLVVVAAGPGLGAAVAARFAREGSAVGLVARSADPLDQIAADLRTSGARAVATAIADVSDEEGLRGALAEISQQLGPVTTLVYNGSLYVEAAPSELAAADLRRAFEVGVTGALVAAQAVLPAMRAAGSGTLLLTGSVAGIRPYAPAAAVGVAKAGLRSLALSLAAELAPDGVQATTVTIHGVLQGSKALDLGQIADVYWGLHHLPPAQWEAEVRFPPLT
jgi:short-subunit dehydrogenase